MVEKKIERNYSIDGLKGIACVLIMVGHFAEIYVLAQDISAIDANIIHRFPSFLSILFTTSFWVRLFFVISGYLICKSRINNFYDVIRKSLLRFLRFYLPILAASIIILLMGLLIGFHTAEIQQ